MALVQARLPLNLTLALQGPTVDQLASQPQGADVFKRALADLLPGVCECLATASSTFPLAPHPFNLESVLCLSQSQRICSMISSVCRNV